MAILTNKLSIFRLNDIFPGITTIRSAYFKLLAIMEAKLHRGNWVTCKHISDDKVLKPKRAEGMDHYNTLYLSAYMLVQAHTRNGRSFCLMKVPQA